MAVQIAKGFTNSTLGKVPEQNTVAFLQYGKNIAYKNSGLITATLH